MSVHEGSDAPPLPGLADPPMRAGREAQRKSENTPSDPPVAQRNRRALSGTVETAEPRTRERLSAAREGDEVLLFPPPPGVGASYVTI